MTLKKKRFDDEKFHEKNKCKKLDNTRLEKSDIIKIIYIHGYFIMHNNMHMQRFFIIHTQTKKSSSENKQKLEYVEISHV